MKNKKSEIIIGDAEFKSLIDDIIKNDKVQEMKKYRQHCDVSTFEHCFFVSYYCYSFCKKMHWDYKSATRAAMLHDLFLYDWRVKGDRKGLHAFTHPYLACENASKIFDLNEKEKDMIKCHMWPLTIKLPSSKEGFVLTLADKYSAINESTRYFIKNVKSNVSFKYAYLLLTFLILRVKEFGRL